jgi:hypothetical protein
MSLRGDASRRELLAMALVAFALRLALFTVATSITGTGLTDYAESADGYQYIAYARAWLGDMAEMDANPYYRRLFPGYPGLIALLSLLGIPVAFASLFPSWLACAAVAPLCAIVFRDRRVGWAAATLTPSYVYSGSLISTEAMCLLFSLLGVLLASRGRSISGGLAFGLGGVFRPVAVFALLGTAVRQTLEGHWRRAAVSIAFAGLAVGAGMAALQWRFGDALMSVHRYTDDPQAYGGEVLTWPFSSLIRTPLETDVAPWKLAFVGVHAVAALGGCILAFRELRAARGEERGPAVEAAVWLWSSTLYVLCIGNVWGFHDFPRFLVPALPPLFFAWRRFLPSRFWVWLAVGALSVALALPPARRRLLEPHTPFAPAAPQSSAAQLHGGPPWPIPGARL